MGDADHWSEMDRDDPVASQGWSSAVQRSGVDDRGGEQEDDHRAIASVVGAGVGAA